MLEHEYQPRRKRPRAGAPPAPLPAEFTYTLREATLQDMPAVLALYRHYVRNSVVTFDEKAPTLAAYKSRFLHLQKLGYPFRLALSPAGTLLGFAYVFPFREKSAFRKTVESSLYWAQQRSVAGSAEHCWVTSSNTAKKQGSRK